MSRTFNKLTRANVKRLEAGKALCEHGILVNRLMDGDLRYSINIMVDRRRVHRVIGKESEGVTRSQAEQAIESFRTKAREGRLDLPSGRKVSPFFEEAAHKYFERLEQIGGKGLSDKSRHLNRYLIPYFGSLRIDKLTEFKVQNYNRKRLDEGVKQATVNRELSTLSHMLRRLADWKWMKPDAIPKIVKGPEPRKQIVVLSTDEQSALLEGALNDQDPYCWLFVAFGLNTGMRHGEILRIRWTDIDFEQRRIYVPQAKAGQREQPITATLAELLKKEREQRCDQNSFVFAVNGTDGKPTHRQTMTRQFKRAVERAKLDPKKFTPHVMRHTAITRLVQAGVDLPTIQKISGHKTLAMVMRYVHLAGNHIDSAITAIEVGLPDHITQVLHTQPQGATNLKVAGIK